MAIQPSIDPEPLEEEARSIFVSHTRSTIDGMKKMVGAGTATRLRMAGGAKGNSSPCRYLPCESQ